MNWSRADISSILIEMKNRGRGKVHRLSSRLGVDSTSIREKMRELRESKRLDRMLSRF